MYATIKCPKIKHTLLIFLIPNSREISHTDNLESAASLSILTNHAQSKTQADVYVTPKIYCVFFGTQCCGKNADPSKFV